jgi:hypothetical protein
MSGYGAASGRHRRADAALVVHLVFADLSETTLGPSSAVARSIGFLATLLADR